MSLSSSLLSLRAGMRLRSIPLALSSQSQRWGHTVRIILKEDMPNGKAYKGEVLHVKAGYARNHLIPGKYAVYATEKNFEKLGIQDPDLETLEQKAERLAREALSDEGAKELKAADLLKHYLRNKVLTLHRKVDPESPQDLNPGMVNARMLRAKLSKQLKIDLENHEIIHIKDEIIEPEDFTSENLLQVVEGMEVSEPCDVKIRKLGNYVARISLDGGYAVPLRFVIVRSE